jgi:hypothetical protein
MREMEAVSSFCGFWGGILFIVANAYYPARLIAKKYFRPWPKDLIQFFKRYLKAHMTLNLIAFLAILIHGHYAEERNIYLTGCFIVTVFLTVEGILMHYRVIPGIQRQLRMLHTQQTLFMLWVLLIIIGHSAV